MIALVFIMALIGYFARNTLVVKTDVPKYQIDKPTITKSPVLDQTHDRDPALPHINSSVLSEGTTTSVPVIHNDRDSFGPSGAVAIPENSIETEKRSVESNSKRVHSGTWILSQPPAFYTIQLMGSSDKTYLYNVADSYKNLNDIACFSKIHKERDWYVLICGLFSDKSQAMMVLDALPQELKANSPWIRRIAGIQQEIVIYEDRKHH